MWDITFVFEDVDHTVDTWYRIFNEVLDSQVLPK